MQDDDSAFEAEMLKQQREHEEEMASEPQVAWQEQGWNSSDDGLSEFKKCVVRDPDGTFISSLMRSERGGEPVLESCGVPRSSLAAAKADVMARGNVDCEVVVHKLTDAVQTHQSAQVEPNTVLLGRNQAAMAERAFEAYNFGEGVAVAGVSGWEYYAAGHERSREVYVANVTNDGNENPSTRLGFTVRFDPQTGVLAEAYAEDATGAAFGCMPEGQLEKLNGRQAAETVLDERADELLGGDGKVSNYIEQASIVLTVTPDELAVIQAGVQEYRELIASPTSADRDARGNEWADREVAASEALLDGKLAVAARRFQTSREVVSSTEAVEHAPTDSVLVSLDGGETFVPATSGVRIIYKDVLVHGEDAPGELHLNATPEGLISDLWVSREEHLDHNLGTSAEMLDDLVLRLVDDPVQEHYDSPSLGM